MLKRTLHKVFLATFFLWVVEVFSQSNNIYYHSNPNTVEEWTSIEISQLMFTDDPIESGILYFRKKGGLSYQEVKMNYENGRWVGIIPSQRVRQGEIEYLTILHKYDGGRISLPFVDAPFDKPLTIRVTPKVMIGRDVEVTNKSEDYALADILILSPENGSVITEDEVVISASLFNAPSVDQNQFQLYINNKDYTDQTVIFGDVLSLVLEGDLDYGFYSVKLFFKTKYGMDVEPIQWNFSISKGVRNFSESFKYNGSIVGKKSYSKASSISLNEQETNTKFSTEISWIKLRYQSRLSDRESKFSQPVNRSSWIIQITDYLKIGRGDVYPSISPYLIDGRRVTNGRYVDASFDYKFGFDGINLFGKQLMGFELNGGFEFESVSGLLTRDIQYQKGISRAVDLITDYTKYDENGDRLYLFNRKGYTFPRKINSYRFAMTLNNSLKAGIHVLKAKDDFNEITTEVPINSLFFVDSTVTGDTLTKLFTLAEFIDSLANGDSSRYKIKEKNWDDGNPQENLVLGFDFEKSLDNRKLLFQMGWNMSLTNTNIWAGKANKDSLDLLMDTIPDGKLLGDYDVSAIGDFIDDFENIFTVNPLYMIPILPIDPISAEENRLRAFLNMPASAYYVRLKGSYMFNNILLEYKQLGPGYKSFGNPYLTNNVREFLINDRLSLLGRRLMFILGYKYRDNKLSELITNPIATRTVSFNTTLVPGPGAPSIIMNIQSIGKTNGIDSVDTDQYGNYLGDSRENSQALNLMASINIPGNFEVFTTTSSINFNSVKYSDNLSSKRDASYFFQKSETQSFSATISARFNFPLKTSSTFSQTKIFIPYLDENAIAQKQENSWSSYIISAQYSFFENRLRTRTGLDFTTNGENKRSINIYGAKLGCDWDIIDNLTLTFNSSIRFDNTSEKINKMNNNGDIESEIVENWSMNSSGVNLTLGYRF